MTSILSSISGYFSKSLILGTFLPTVIFIVLSILFLVPLLPADLSLILRFQEIDKEWKVVAVSFVTIVLTGLIYNLNIPLLRLYEGYPWRYSWMGKRLTRRHKARFDQAENRIDAWRACRSLMEAKTKSITSQTEFIKEFDEAWSALGPRRNEIHLKEYPWLEIWSNSNPEYAQLHTEEQWKAITNYVIDEYSAHRREIKSSYPDKRGLILPTRLGNAIRSFESYSRREYGIDSIELWPRLIGIVPKDFAVAVDDAKTTFDFMLNCSALSLLLAILMVLAGLTYPTQLASPTPLLEWLITISIFTFLWYCFYQLAVNRVGAWGALVKSAFDLYRWELLKKLGYKQEPESRKEERDIWQEISRQMLYGDRYDNVLKDYAKDPESSPPFVSSSPGNVKLQVTKGLKVNRWNDVVTFYWRVKNPSLSLAEADVILTDKLTDDFEYEWDSAKVENQSVPVMGANPYKFKIGNLLSNAEVVLSYNAIPRTKRP